MTIIFGLFWNFERGGERRTTLVKLGDYKIESECDKMSFEVRIP